MGMPAMSGLGKLDQTAHIVRKEQTGGSTGAEKTAKKQKPKAKGNFQWGRPAAGIVLLLGDGQQPEKVVTTCQLRKGEPSWELPKGGLEEAIVKILRLQQP